MTIDSFATLLDAARARPEPQLLLLTFAALEAEPGRPGRQALMPVACVDKRATDVTDFTTLAQEAVEALGGIAALSDGSATLTTASVRL